MPDVVALRGRAWTMNPNWWTPERVDRYKRKSPRVHQTDLCAEFGVSEEAAFDYQDVEAAFMPRPELAQYTMCTPLISCDFSSLRRDETVAIVAAMCQPPPSEPMLHDGHGNVLPRGAPGPGVVMYGERGQLFHPPLPSNVCLVRQVIGWQPGQRMMHEIVETIAGLAYRIGADVVGDQREAASLESMFSMHGATFHSIPWGQANKEEAVTILRRWMNERRLVLPADPILKSQLLNYAERKTASGGYRYEGRGRHDDRAAALLTLAMAAEHKLLPGAPAYVGHGKHVIENL